MPPFLQVCIIDDDKTHSLALKALIEKRLAQTVVVAFTDPNEGYIYLERSCVQNQLNTLLILNLRMPNISGWQLLDKLSHCIPAGFDKLNIYILTASDDPQDEVRAKKHPLIAKFIRKPMSMEFLSELFTRNSVLYAVHNG